MLKLGKSISQLLPYASECIRGTEDSLCYWMIKSYQFTSFDFLEYLCHSKHSYRSLSPSSPHIFLTRLHPLHLSVLYLALCLISQAAFFTSPFSFHLPSSFSCCLSSTHFNPLSSRANGSLHLPLPLYLSWPHCLWQWRAFSISAPLLQINDLICRNNQVSSTLSPIPFPSCHY